MPSVRFVLFVIILIFHAKAIFAQAGPAFGAFSGVVRIDDIEKDQLVKLELIPSRESEASIALKAILTLQFGGFESGEYVSFHFDNVIFNLLDQTLTFDQADQEVYLTSAKLRNGTIEGNLFSSSGLVGIVRLSTVSPPRPEKPLIEPLNGEYRGQCDGKPTSLQLITYRSTEDTSRLGNSFGSYEVKGYVGRNDRFCGQGDNQFCVSSKITSTSYNFFRGDLVLDGYPESYNCTVDGPKIKCGDCVLRRHSNEMKRPQVAIKKYERDPVQSLIVPTSSDPSAMEIKGRYVGYVFHENLNKYQRIQIDINTYLEAGTLMISAVSKLQFGDSDTEVIPYRFNPVPFPNPTTRPQFILARPESDVDALLRVEDLGGGVVKGTWYSILFGRVGSFLATKNGNLPSIPETDLIDSVSRQYEQMGSIRNQDLIVNIVVIQGRGPIGSDNPFFPLNIGGYVWRKNGVVQKKSIIKGSYDFYTGRIGIFYDDERVVSGILTTGVPVQFRRLGGGFNTLMQEFELSPFESK